MNGRIGITILILTGFLSGLAVTQQREMVWEYNHLFLAPGTAVPFQTAESENRERPATVVSATQAKRVVQRIKPIVGERPREISSRRPQLPIPRAPLSPLLPRFSPRAPPPVC